MNKSTTRNLFLALLALIAILLSVSVPTPWTGLSFLAVAVLLFFAGYSMVSNFDVIEGGEVVTARTVVVSIGIGLALSLLLWTLSAYATGGLLGGTILTAGAAIFGGVRFYRRRPRLGELFTSPTALLISTVALLSGVYLYGVNEIELGNSLLFTYRMDWWSHLSTASLIRESGLPLISLHGSSKFPYSHTTHVGYPVIIAGVTQVTQTTLYQAARIVLPLCYWLIPMSAWCVVQNLDLGKRGKVIAAMSGLFASGLCLPHSLLTSNYDAVVDPYTSAPLKMNAPSGSLYHNGTQLVAVALVAIALVAIDRYCRQLKLSWLAAGAGLVAVSGMVKPSTFIVFAPALVLSLVFIRRPRRLALATTLGIFVSGFLLYLLPSLLLSVRSKGMAWSLDPANLIYIESLAPPLNMLGLGLLPFVGWFIKRGIPFIKSKKIEWYDVSVIALLGGILFSILFSETERPHHGNQNWSAIGAVIVTAPYLTATLIRWFNRPPSHLILTLCVRIVIPFVLFFQFLQAGIYSIAFPHLSPIMIEKRCVAIVEQARTLTEPGDTFLVDPELKEALKSNIRVYLGRPELHNFSAYPKEVRREYLRWKYTVARRSKKYIQSLLGSRSAVIIGKRTRFLVKTLKDLNWKKRRIDPHGKYSLWLAG